MSDFIDKILDDVELTNDNNIEELQETEQVEEANQQEELTEPDLIKNIEEALKFKEEGNELFRNKEYEDASEIYSKAIDYCPNDDINKENLATFFGNRAACYFAMNEYDLTIEDCTEALKLKENYTKVLVRRSQAYEKVEKIEEALEDMKKVKEIDPNYPKINDIINRLQKDRDEKFNKMKDEAMGNTFSFLNIT